MRVVGEWLECGDGAVRPVVRVQVTSRTGRVLSESFLIDSGADRTVFSADLLRRLEAPIDPPSTGDGLRGIGGGAEFVLVSTIIQLRRDDGMPVNVRADFAAFTDESAMDMSILGRDVRDNFDVILSRRRDEVLLLAGNHQDHVSPV
jgi:hypothetical protein